MSDQCRLCDIKDVRRCTEASESGYVCSIPHSWYAGQKDAEIAALKERIKELIAAYDEYAEVLVAEIDDLNGFRSSGTEAGKKARDRINKAEQALKEASHE